MKISLIGPVYPFRGGIAHYTAMLAKSIQAVGHSCQVISFRCQYPAFLYPGQSDRDPSRQALRTQAEYLLDPLYPWTWFQAARQITRFNPQLIAINWWTTFWAPAFAVLSRLLTRRGYPLVYIIHNVLPHEARPWDPLAARLALVAATTSVVQTQKEKERLVKLLPGAQVELVSLPSFTHLYNLRVPKEHARSMLHLPPDAPVLLFFGIVRAYKGLDVLLEALGMLKSEGIKPYLLIGGEFWEKRDDYQRQIEQLGLEDQLMIDDRYLPNEEAALLFSAADVFIAPYTGGTQSGTAAVAQAFGLPMIVTQQVAAGMPAEVAAQIRVVPAGDAPALAGAITGFLAHPAPSVNHRARTSGEDWGRLVAVLERVVSGASAAEPSP